MAGRSKQKKAAANGGRPGLKGPRYQVTLTEDLDAYLQWRIRSDKEEDPPGVLRRALRALSKAEPMTEASA